MGITRKQVCAPSLCLLAPEVWCLCHSADCFVHLCTSWSSGQALPVAFMNCGYSMVSLCVPSLPAFETNIHILRCLDLSSYPSVRSPLIVIFYYTSSISAKWVLAHFLWLYEYFHYILLFSLFRVLMIILCSPSWLCGIFCTMNIIFLPWLFVTSVCLLSPLPQVSTPPRWMSAYVAAPSEFVLQWNARTSVVTTHALQTFEHVLWVLLSLPCCPLLDHHHLFMSSVF